MRKKEKKREEGKRIKIREQIKADRIGLKKTILFLTGIYRSNLNKLSSHFTGHKHLIHNDKHNWVFCVRVI